MREVPAVSLSRHKKYARSIDRTVLQQKNAQCILTRTKRLSPYAAAVAVAATVVVAAAVAMPHTLTPALGGTLGRQSCVLTLTR